MLAGKKIILAICGSIAVYKTAFLVRLLTKEEADVKVIMTESAQDFVAPLTFSTLSKNMVFLDFFNKTNGEWYNHVKLALWADLMIVAPLSANTLSKMANGLCDNLLLATYLSIKCPVIVAPAMDIDMYRHPTTRENLKRLKSFGNEIIEARDGELASGLVGQGRMAEPEDIIEVVKKKDSNSQALKGKKVLISSGPTFEAIDAVRFIGNHSSGKMGTALANAFKNSGASIIMVSGPSNHLPSHGEIIKVISANEMLDEMQKKYSEADIVVFCAAVSDYRPKDPFLEKIKKNNDTLHLTMVKTPDIAFELGKKKKNQLHIGFALETTNEEMNAKEKLIKKNFDLIVLNSLNDQGAGFQQDSNEVTFFDRNNNKQKFELKDKAEVAEDIVKFVIETVS